MKPNKETIHALEEYLELCDFFVAMLQKWNKLDNHFQLALCNPSLGTS
jgi:hypothetical protein